MVSLLLFLLMYLRAALTAILPPGTSMPAASAPISKRKSWSSALPRYSVNTREPEVMVPVTPSSSRIPSLPFRYPFIFESINGTIVELDGRNFYVFFEDFVGLDTFDHFGE